MNFIAVIFVKFYKFFLSPFITSSCRFYPSCSGYFLFVLSRYRFVTSFVLILKRILKCFFLNGGYDPSP